MKPVDHPLTDNQRQLCNQCLAEHRRVAALVDKWERTGADVVEPKRILDHYADRLAKYKKEFWPDKP